MKFTHVLFSAVLVFTGVSPALAFDPFDAPPKNMAEPTGSINPQSITPIEIQEINTPSPPPPGFATEEEESADGIKEISGKLMVNEEITDKEKTEGLHFYILETKSEAIELNTSKDLDMFVGQMVTVYAEEVDGEFSIRSLTISEANVDNFMDSADEMDIPKEEMMKPEESEKTTATGPNAYVIGVALVFVLFTGTLLFVARRKKTAPVEIPEDRINPYDQ